MAPRTIALDSKGLDAAIDALSGAVDTFRLTRFERRSFRALVASVDLAVVSLFCMIVQFEVAAVVFALSLLVGAVSLALNFPLFLRLARENAKLKELGLSDLSRSLWEESRKRRWISLARGVLLALLGASALVIAILGLLVSERQQADVIYIVFFALVSGLLFATRYLRNQRERMDIVADAEGLRKALSDLRQRAGSAGSVPVPSQLLERAATIESVQIAKERRDALLQSAGDRPAGYAVTFESDAAAQRSALDVRERTDLEDLVARLSTGQGLAPGAGPAGSGASTPGRAEEGRVEVEFTVDPAARSIRVDQVRARVEDAARIQAGARHA
ncbi:MAG TPA: hypothetical protein VMG60_07730 [Burkholderiaceae bacterium]|nr:hypothetical protein [Burkholderiaceae bacterium]